MAAEEARELERLAASVTRLEPPGGARARPGERPEAKREQLTPLTTPAVLEGPSLQELLALLVGHTSDSRALLVRIQRQLEQMGDGGDGQSA